MRECRTCGESKPLMDFYSQTNGSLDRDCKPCRCAKVRASRLVNVDRYREFDRQRANLPHRIAAREAYAQTPEGREKATRAKRAYIERNPIKRAAHLAVGNALRDGKLTRQPCEVCGEAKAHAHHCDYGKPLEVMWLCTTHHAAWHKENDPIVPAADLAA